MALRIEPGAVDIWSRLGVVTEALASDFFSVHDEPNGVLLVRLLRSRLNKINFFSFAALTIVLSSLFKQECSLFLACLLVMAIMLALV